VSDRIAVTAGDFVRQIGRWQTDALQHPISITHHGRERLVLCSAARFNEMAANAPDEQVVRLQAFSTALINNMSDGWIAIDADLFITALNRAAASLLSGAPNDLIGKSLAECLPSLASRTLKDQIAEVRRSGRDESVSLDLSRDGAASPVSAKILVVNDQTHILLTDQTLACALEDAKAFDTAVEIGSSGAKFEVNNVGRITGDAKKLCALLGLGPDDLRGARLADIVQPSDRKKIAEALDQIQKTTEGVSISVNLIHRTKTVRASALALTPILSKGAIRAIAAVVCLTCGEQAA
jgi:PAS domain-containing protein